MHGTRFYGIWEDLQDRCTNKNNLAFAYYGGRGIKCLWPSFETFRDDMYASYLEHVTKHGEKHTTLDRFPDKDGSYCKENTRWTTMKQQMRNMRRNRLLTFQGITKPLVEWAEIYNINQKTLWARLKYGWPIGAALLTPVNSKNLN